MNRQISTIRNTKLTVGIIGSAGSYGRWFADWLRDAMQAEVIGNDPNDPQSLSPQALIDSSDVLIFSTPVSRTVAVIEEYTQIAGERASDQLWLDLTSVKQAPVQAMLASRAEVVGLHPMTAPPKAPTLRGRVIVVCEVRLDRWRKWMELFLDRLQADCVLISPAEHDRRMAVVQNMTHAMHLAQSSAISEFCANQLSISDLMACRTAGFEMDMASSQRILAGNASLYADILLANPFAEQAVTVLLNQLSKLRQRLVARDHAAICAVDIQRPRRWFGADAVAQGNYSFERIGYLLADLNDQKVLSVHLSVDQPGSLRQLLAIFEMHKISLHSMHSSRTPAGEVHFQMSFARETADQAIVDARKQIESSGLGRILDN